MNRTSRALKNSRVKVAVRCRPAFQDEIDFAKGEFVSIVQTKEESLVSRDMAQVSLATITGKQREFFFDYAFGEESTQDFVYDRLARPVVREVLRGYNGTIFAYGQTGTGKTYTMGILEFVNNEHAGLIPRAIHQIFEYAEAAEVEEVTITQSFLQLYREQIQDLLAPVSQGSEESLAIREDPARGFFVEGLKEYVVKSYRESEALINLGLENRAIAPTLMNATSSRSHTVLTLRIEQRVAGDENNPQSYAKTLRSKLLMVDLAGSERVRRTVSRGARLSEAKSINSSLSALGNVIAALAEHSAHVPYRDSKLTRLLQDSLGGGAATALIATIGPAPLNYGETLSTLLFAQRCMAVKISPVAHEEVDYAEMCAKLQLQLSRVEGDWGERLRRQGEQSEETIQRLRGELELQRDLALQQSYSAQSNNFSGQDFEQTLREVLGGMERVYRGEDEGALWLNKPEAFDLLSFLSQEGVQRHLPCSLPPSAQVVLCLGYCYETLRNLSLSLHQVLSENIERESAEKEQLQGELEEESAQSRFREEERLLMLRHDPQGERQGGRHLAPLSRLEAKTRVEGQFPSNNAPLSRFDRASVSPLPDSPQALQQLCPPSLHSFPSLSVLCEQLTNLHAVGLKNLEGLRATLQRKDFQFRKVKDTLSEQILERRRREEEVVNWSYVLKYLLASSSKLRRELHAEKKKGREGGAPFPAASLAASLPPPFSAPLPPPQDQEDERERKRGEGSEGSAVGKLFAPLPLSPSPSTSSFASSQPPAPMPRPNLSPLPVGGSDEEGEEVSLTSTSRSFRSAATPNSIPPPRYRPSRRHSSSLPSSSLPSSSFPSSSFPSSLPLSSQPPARPVSLAPPAPPAPAPAPARAFAERVALQLLGGMGGVRGEGGREVVGVIERLASLSERQIELLDGETRQQVRELRRQLGIPSGGREREERERKGEGRGEGRGEGGRRSLSAPRPARSEAGMGRSQTKPSPSLPSPLRGGYATPLYRGRAQSSGRGGGRGGGSSDEEEEEEDNFSQLDMLSSRR